MKERSKKVSEQLRLGGGSFKRKASFASRVRVFVELFCCSISSHKYSGAVRSIKALKVKINSLYTILSSILSQCRYYRREEEISYVLSVVGDEIYTLLKGIVTHKSPRDIKLDELLKHLAKDFTPDTNAIVERYRFYNWTRSSGQSIMSCIAKIKARLCQFGKTEECTELTPQLILEESLRDRLVCGISYIKSQRILLREHKFTFSTAVEIATDMETSQLTSRTFGSVSWISKKQ